MKQRNLFSILLCLLCIHNHHNVYSQEITTVTYIDNFAQGNTSSNVFVPLRAKSMRKNSQKGGNIKITFESSMADSLKQAINIASDLWADCLPTGAEVQIGVQFGNVGNDMEVQVFGVSSDTIFYPLSIYRNMVMSNYVSNTRDAVLTLSDTVNWDCSYSIINNTHKHLTTAVLRGIAIALGFGTTVRQISKGNEEIIIFDNTGESYSPFEYLVSDSQGNHLCNIPKGSKKRDNTVLRAFCQPTDSIMINGSNAIYKLYSPTPFVKNKSMIFLDKPYSLMHYDYLNGGKCLAIDDTTIDIMKAIGWDIESTSMSIYCNGIPSTGIPSAYGSYTFSINNYNQSITNPRWEYSVLNANKEYEIISQQTSGQTFTISLNMNGLNTPYINCDGDIEGVVRFIYTLNGEEHSLHYGLTLECAPQILAISNQCAHFENHIALYDYSFNVDYVGAQQITIGVEQEYSPYYDYYVVQEPFLAHAFIQGLSRGNMVWLDISITNNYGSDFYTIEIPVQSLTKWNEVEQSDIIGDHQAHHQVHHINLYTLDGRFLDQVEDISSLSKYHSCTLIMKYMDKDDKEIRVKKINFK